MKVDDETRSFDVFEAFVHTKGSPTLKVEWVRLGWRGKGPGQMFYGDDLFVEDDSRGLARRFAVEGQLRAVGGVRIDLDPSHTQYIERLSFRSEDRTLRQNCEREMAELQETYRGIFEVYAYSGVELAQLQREMSNALMNLDGMCRLELIGARESNLRWTALRAEEEPRPDGVVDRPESVPLPEAPRPSQSEPVAPSRPRVPPETAAAPDEEQDRPMSCEERRDYWRQQGQPEWLIRESLASVGC